MGCLLSGDILGIAGKYGKREEKTLKKLLLDNKIFCLAVDAHKAEDYVLDTSRKKLLRLLKDQAKVDELVVTNPGKVIRGEV